MFGQLFKHSKLKEVEDILNDFGSKIPGDYCHSWKKVQEMILDNITHNKDAFISDTLPTQERIYNMIGLFAERIYVNHSNFFYAGAEDDLIRMWKFAAKKLYDEKMIPKDEFDKISRGIENAIKYKQEEYPKTIVDDRDEMINNPLNT
ncbi:MAG: hypothetical protein FWD15_04790 [Alphaproteobacteria bacterium]|nr:hypothetical protein [Alphaproteobacteria bacterium]